MVVRNNSNRLKKFLIAFSVLLIFGLAGLSAYLYTDNRDLRDQLTLTNEQKNERLISEINKVYDLPEGTPVVGIVNDVEQFKKDFPIFANDDVRNNDYLLVYRKARLNILYRQSEKRVVKTANVNVPVTVEIIGSEAAIAATEAKLADFGTQITIVKTVSAGITQSFIFDVDNDQKSEIESIAGRVGIEIGSTLPSTIQPGAQTEVVIAVSDSAELTTESNTETDTGANQDTERP